MRDRFVWTSGEVRRALGQPAEGEGRRYSGVSTDTRTIEPGELFVALRGDRFDAHDFLGDAADAES